SSLLYFFFSSRRRHTRFSRDWSSDVCSSDLQRRHLDSLVAVGDRQPLGESQGSVFRDRILGSLQVGEKTGCRHRGQEVTLAPRRSEERRVGKECRARWSAKQQKQKKLIQARD